MARPSKTAAIDFTTTHDLTHGLLERANCTPDKSYVLLKDADKKDIPVECVKRIVIKLKDNRRRYLNISSLRKQGLNIAQMEAVISAKLTEYENNILGLDFFVDVESVAELVQPETDKILGKL